MHYRIHFDLDPASLQGTYRDGQYVTMVKHVDSTLPAVGALTWIAFAPFQRNTVAWEDPCALFASTTRLEKGKEVEILASIAAQTGSIYVLRDERFDGAMPGPPGEYTAANGEGHPVTFGLAQEATVNAVAMRAPSVAVPVPGGETVGFVPSEEVSVFLAPFRSGGILLDAVPPDALRVKLSPASPEARLAFHRATMTFRSSRS